MSIEIKCAELLGRRVGHYQLVGVLGGGGFACVYRGQWGAGQEVALKISRRSLDSPESRSDFEREVRIVSRLNHPNIIRLLDYGIYEVELHGQQLALPYLVMPLAPGGSLRQLVPRGQRLPLEQVVTYVQQVAAALQYAHDFREPDGRANAILHLDVKPANMLVGERGQIWLSDFGIAIIGHKTLRAADPQAASQMLLAEEEVWGSPEYMAPERFDGQRRRASDQYALAVTCYEWLAGAPPFSSSAPDLLARQQELMRLQRTQPPPSLTARFGDIPPAVEAVIFKALAKEPDLRYPSVKAFAEALEQAAAQSRPSQSRPTSMPRPTPVSPSSPPSSPPHTPPATPGPIPASTPVSPSPAIFLRGPSSLPGASAVSGTLPAFSAGFLKGPAFSLVPPAVKPVHFFSGHRSFLLLPDFRLFRFVHCLLIILAGLLLLVALPKLWPLILLSIPLLVALFYLAISRRKPLAMQLLALPVALYYAVSCGQLCMWLIARLWPGLPLLSLVALLPALAACCAALYSIHRYGVQRLRW
ncbi:MAG: serine/threonine protein kinase [Thermogemmatispora sp.]|uniref:serine/threonine protein kinase n=1 Tax=Thermogemmatispora sp. TaxID=1968838 RepID=UPI00260B0FE0|nr:serine/threonine-protein kinase [Thermogemmatispora sp.]MBX5456720.1 serine/threonine protein kinase [Thermogemmatispora sp.]